eukprot:tig00020704_g13211.t1
MASEEAAPADGAAASTDVAPSSAGPSHDRGRASTASTAAAAPTAAASPNPPSPSHPPPEPPAPPSAPATAPGSPFRAGAAPAPPAPALTLTRAAEAPGPPGPPPPLSLPAFPADFRAATAPAQLSRRSSQSQAVSESIGLLRTMRLRGGAGSPHADGALYLRHGEMALNKRMWKDGAEQLLVCLAYNDGDPRASHSFGSAVEHIRRDRPFWDPVVKPRQSLDVGGLVRTRTRRLADLDPVKARPRAPHPQDHRRLS